MAMRLFTSDTTLDEIIGAYGPDWTEGILSEHVHLAEERGARIHTAASGAQWVIPANGPAIKVLCSHLVWIYTEGGRIDGRCGRHNCFHEETTS